MKPDLTKPIRALVRLGANERKEAAAQIRLRRKYKTTAFSLANARALILYRFA